MQRRIEEAFNLFLSKSGSDTVKPADIVNAMRKSKYDILKPSIFEVRSTHLIVKAQIL